MSGLNEWIQQAFNSLVDTFGVLGIIGAVLLLIVVMILQAIIAPIVSEAILSAAGGVFSRAFGTAGITAAIIGGIIGSMLGAWVAFLIARWLQAQIKIKFIDNYKNDLNEIEAEGFFARIAKFLARFIDDESEDFIGLIEKRGFLIILIGRILPFIPFDAISYAAGLTKVRFRDFMVATFIGTIPRVTFYILMGSEFGERLGEGEFNVFYWMFAIVVITLLGLYKLSMNIVRKQSQSIESDVVSSV